LVNRIFREDGKQTGFSLQKKGLSKKWSWFTNALSTGWLFAATQSVKKYSEDFAWLGVQTVTQIYDILAI